MATRPTGRGRGRPPTPIEDRRRLGNPSGRPLPKPGTLVPLQGVSSIPEPERALGEAGRALWGRIWGSGASWLAKGVDYDHCLGLCEQMDERATLRAAVMENGDWRERNGLRQLDAQIMAGLGVIGFTPVERTRMQVAEVVPPTALERLLAEHSTAGRKA